LANQKERTMKGEQEFTMDSIRNKMRNLHTSRVNTATFIFFIFFIGLCLCNPSLWAAPAEKASRKPAAAPSAGKAPSAAVKSPSINDSNINAALKRADEMMGKGEVDGPLKILVSVYEYSKDVLFTVKFFQGHYEKTVNDPSTTERKRRNLH
jgi:hypothetical protein